MRHRRANERPRRCGFETQRATGIRVRAERPSSDGPRRRSDGANLNPTGMRKVVFHDLRGTFASLLIAEGAGVVFVSRQLGHASPAITLRFYAHLFNQARHPALTREEA